MTADRNGAGELPWPGPEQPPHLGDEVTAVGPDRVLAAFTEPGRRAATTIGELRSTIEFVDPQWSLTDWVRGAAGTVEADRAVTAARTLVDEPFDVTGAGLGRSERYGFHYLRWLTPLPKAWLLTGDPQFVRTFETLVDDWCGARESVTGEWPGLHVVWYSLGIWSRSKVLLPALAAFGSELSDRCWGQVLGTLLGGAAWLAAEHTTFRHGNWQLVAATQLVNLAASFPGLRDAPVWYRLGRQRILDHLELDFHPDGGHYERSPGYHEMCLDALQLAATVDRLHGTGELAEHPRLVQAHRWLCELTTDGGWVPPLQDTPIVFPAPLLQRGALVLADPDLANRAKRWLTAAEWTAGSLGLPAALPRPDGWDFLPDADDPAGPGEPSRLLPDSGYTILRRPGISLTVNHGHHIEHELESHSHRAILDFVLEHRGTPLLWEAGGPPHYDVPDYLTWYQSARGHNTVLVDEGEPDTDRGVWAAPPIDHPAVTATTSGHHANGFPQRRSFVLCKGSEHLVVHDRADTTEAHRYTALFHGLHPWQSDGDAHTSGPVTVQTISMDTTTTRPITADGRTDRSNGRARVPDNASRTAEFADLHTLALHGPTGNLSSVISWSPAPPSVRREGDHLLVEDDRYRHRHGTNWTLQLPAGPMPPEDPAVGSVWLGNRLGPAESPVFTATSPVTAAWAARSRGDDALDWTLTVSCTDRTRLQFRGRHRDITLDDVVLELRPHTELTVALPHAGVWRLTGTGPASVLDQPVTTGDPVGRAGHG